MKQKSLFQRFESTDAFKDAQKWVLFSKASGIYIPPPPQTCEFQKKSHLVAFTSEPWIIDIHMIQNYIMHLHPQCNWSRSQAIAQQRMSVQLPVFACFGGDAWLLPAGLMDLMVIWYKVAAFRPVTVPGELATTVSMTVFPSLAVRR